MPTVGVWSSDTITIVPDILLVHQEDFPFFSELTRAGELPCPARVFVVAPNGTGMEELLCLYVLGEHLQWDLAAIEASMPSFSVRYGAWSNVVQSLSGLDHVKASASIRELADRAHPKQSRMSRLVDVLSSYVNHCVQPLSDLRLFREVQHNQSMPWWQTSSVYTDSIAKFQKSLAQALQEMPALVVLDRAATSAARPWTAMLGKPTEEKFFDLSAFCFGWAERHAASKDFQWAFLLAYRSVDLYFQYLGLESGVLIEKTDELGYPGSLDKVHLVDLEHQLFKSQKLASDESRRQFLVRINTARNRLFFTHGAHHVTEYEVTDILKTVSKTVERIESSTKWHQRANAFYPGIENALKMLFESVPDIHTFVDDRTASMATA